MCSPLTTGDVIGVDRTGKHQWAVNELAFSSREEMKNKNNVGHVQNNVSNNLLYRNNKQSSNTHYLSVFQASVLVIWILAGDQPD